MAFDARIARDRRPLWFVPLCSGAVRVGDRPQRRQVETSSPDRWSSGPAEEEYLLSRSSRAAGSCAINRSFLHTLCNKRMFSARLKRRLFAPPAGSISSAGPPLLQRSGDDVLEALRSLHGADTTLIMDNSPGRISPTW
jgi:hypothetical protein